MSLIINFTYIQQIHSNIFKQKIIVNLFGLNNFALKTVYLPTPIKRYNINCTIKYKFSLPVCVCALRRRDASCTIHTSRTQSICKPRQFVIVFPISQL